MYCTFGRQLIIFTNISQIVNLEFAVVFTSIQILKRMKKLMHIYILIYTFWNRNQNFLCSVWNVKWEYKRSIAKSFCINKEISEN